jgi:hypothetical protein
MGTPHRQQDGGYWGASLVAWLLVAWLSRPGYGFEGPEPHAGEDHQASQLHVTVRQWRLSVNLWEAEVGEVLTRIAQEAGLAILGSSRAGTKVSVQFTDVALEHGLRRLLRLVSLSHAILYARSPTGLAVHEVWVFEAAQEEPLHQPITAERNTEEPVAEVSPLGANVSGQVQVASPTAPRGKVSAVWCHLRDHLGALRHHPTPGG